MLGKAICCADDWFMRNGTYVWNYKHIGDAHNWCQRKCNRYMQIGAERIVIANTNVTAKSMQPYFDMAKEYGYNVFSIIVENRMSTKNIHSVPDETLDKMRNKFEIKL